jgi:hypothetical protein
MEVFRDGLEKIMDVYEREEVDYLEILSDDLLDQYLYYSALLHIIDHFDSIRVKETHLSFFFIILLFIFRKKIIILVDDLKYSIKLILIMAISYVL